MRKLGSHLTPTIAILKDLSSLHSSNKTMGKLSTLHKISLAEYANPSLIVIHIPSLSHQLRIALPRVDTDLYLLISSLPHTTRSRSIPANEQSSSNCRFIWCVRCSFPIVVVPVLLPPPPQSSTITPCKCTYLLRADTQYYIWWYVITTMDESVRFWGWQGLSDVCLSVCKPACLPVMPLPIGNSSTADSLDPSRLVRLSTNVLHVSYAMASSSMRSGATAAGEGDRLGTMSATN